ncbi:MAG: hypothetical protein RM368_26075 [Nostoc sp. DedSLP03]|uniref:hypothetical protein n=1 Tax=Nostoc sp. DedSLP03 TaxID=3075400 RepID=UPI002AD2B939|nr:hypothetical protein [Nostoc sp. DedSLP03]MDZ7968377.1 hypothetical protein [Nostoc sp. DedSLP03]
MATVKINDLNSSESDILYELTDAESLDIKGGSLFKDLLGVALIVTGVFTSPVIGTALIAGGVNLINGGSSKNSSNVGESTKKIQSVNRDGSLSNSNSDNLGVQSKNKIPQMSSI